MSIAPSADMQSSFSRMNQRDNALHANILSGIQKWIVDAQSTALSAINAGIRPTSRRPVFLPSRKRFGMIIRLNQHTGKAIDKNSS
jgi:hypothetical protein